MSIKIHICKTAAEAQQAITYYGADKLVDCGPMPRDDVQVFEGPDTAASKLNYIGQKRFVAVFKV